MPVYTLACRRPLSADATKKVSHAITDIHCEVTGAPPEFVNIVFMNGHRVRGGKALGVIGNVRKGGNRNKELTDDLRDQLRDGIAKAAGLAASDVNVELLGFEASRAMEGGEILPQPGDENVWLERSAARKA